MKPQLNLTKMPCLAVNTSTLAIACITAMCQVRKCFTDGWYWFILSIEIFIELTTLGLCINNVPRTPYPNRDVPHFKATPINSIATIVSISVPYN